MQWAILSFVSCLYCNICNCLFQSRRSCCFAANEA